MPRKQNTLKEGFWGAFPTRLRTLFADTGRTQQELADYLGLKSRQSITAYVDGTSSPPWQTIAKIANFFDVPSDYLLGLSDVKSYDADLQAVCKYTGLSSGAVQELKTHRVDIEILNFMLENAIIGGVEQIADYLRYAVVDRKYIVDSFGNVEPIFDVGLALDRMEKMREEYAPNSEYKAETVNIGLVLLRRKEDEILNSLDRLRGEYQKQKKGGNNG